jgi:hypothetical protein
MKPLASTVWTTPAAERELADEAKATVAGWFRRAKERKGYGVGVNLYYPLFGKEFEQVTKKFVYRGVDTGLLIHDNALWQLRSGSGDCEMNLYYVGTMRR